MTIVPIPFGTRPTPLEPAPRLAAALGLDADDLWFKRDDLFGLGGGGNKVRKLGYLCAVALANGATRVVTTGAAQSNHARLTAAAGARTGLKVTLVLAGTAPAQASGNLILNHLFDADIRWAADQPVSEVAAAVTAELTQAGDTVELIPFGGSNAIGARAYIDCATEVLAQLPEVDQVVTGVGSGGTMAGLIAGLGLDRVYGVSVGAVPDPTERITTLVTELGNPAPGPIELSMDQVGAGYGHLTPESLAAMQLTARTEGIVLDPIYTGRAMAGLIQAVQSGRITSGQRTVFLHTGGLPGLFGHPEMPGLSA